MSNYGDVNGDVNTFSKSYSLSYLLLVLAVANLMLIVPLNSNVNS